MHASIVCNDMVQGRELAHVLGLVPGVWWLVVGLNTIRESFATIQTELCNGVGKGVKYGCIIIIV